MIRSSHIPLLPHTAECEAGSHDSERLLVTDLDDQREAGSPHSVARAAAVPTRSPPRHPIDAVRVSRGERYSLGALNSYFKLGMN